MIIDAIDPLNQNNNALKDQFLDDIIDDQNVLLRVDTVAATYMDIMKTSEYKERLRWSGYTLT